MICYARKGYIGLDKFSNFKEVNIRKFFSNNKIFYIICAQNKSRIFWFKEIIVVSVFSIKKEPHTRDTLSML